jgi:aquaporin Z
MPGRVFMGLGTGTTLIAIRMSPWSKQSGGHLNPAITLAFYRLGKLELSDTLSAPDNSLVRSRAYPSRHMCSEASSEMRPFTMGYSARRLRENLSRYTPYFAGALVAVCTAFESPLSGSSANPARTSRPAIIASYWHALWIYFTAPPFGMQAAAEAFRFSVVALVPFAPSCIMPITNVVYCITGTEQCLRFSGRPPQLEGVVRCGRPSAGRMS